MNARKLTQENIMIEIPDLPVGSPDRLRPGGDDRPVGELPDPYPVVVRRRVRLGRRGRGARRGVILHLHQGGCMVGGKKGFQLFEEKKLK